MTRGFTSLLLALAALLTCSSAAYAQLKEDGELNLFGGVSVHSKNEYEVGFPQAIRPVPGKFRLDNAIRGGVRLNVHTVGHWGEEFFYSYAPSKAHFLRSTPTRTMDLDTQVHNLGANALYYFQGDDTARTRVFLTIGLGVTIYRPTAEARSFARDPARGNLPDLAQSNELTMNYGIGFKSRLGGRVGFRMDARGFVGRSPGFGLARESDNPAATVFPATGAIHNGEASAGLIFYFRKQ